MREIKFRSKRLGKWVYGDLLQGLEDDKYIIISYDEGVAKYEVDPDTVGQFTGLHDKNGKEIYEGDVLLYNRMKLFVKWRQEDCRFVLIGLHDKDYVLNAYKCNIEDDFKVIGNIHDNPELLKGGEK